MSIIDVSNRYKAISIEDIDNIDIKSLLDCKEITFYNRSDEYSYIDYRCMDDTSFANKCFRVVKQLRENNYKGHVILDCDSLFDLSNSYFNYDCMDTCFSKCLYSMEAVNNLVNCYLCNTEDVLVDEMSKRDLFCKIIFFQIKEIYNHIELKSIMREDISRNIYNYICLGIVYDIGKILGANFIKYSDEESDILYYFDSNSDEVFKYFPTEMLDRVITILNRNKGFLEYADCENSDLLEDIGKAYDSIIENKLLEEIDFTTVYDDLLNCKSKDDFYKILDDSDLEFYYKLLLNILMDMSYDDYIDFIENSTCGNLKIDLDTVIELVLSVKSKLTKNKIEMTICHQ